MRQIFRFFRGELSGFFVNALCVFLNIHLSVTKFLDEMAYALNAQWQLEAQQIAERPSLREEDIFNIGMIGGLFQPRTFAFSSMGSVWFSPSSKLIHPNLAERSERGLVRTDFEDFIFVRTAHDTYDNDITEESSDERRITLIKHGAVPLGYVKEGTPLFTRDGQVIEANLLSSPPDDGAYIEWFGTNTLHLEEFFESDNLPLSVDVFKALFETAQKIRRGAVSLSALLEVTQVLGQGYIKDIEINQQGNVFFCHYSLDSSVEVFNRERRYAAWLSITQMKFKEFVFIERETGEV